MGETMSKHKSRDRKSAASSPTEKKSGIEHLVAATNYSLSGVEMASHETAIRHEIILGVFHFIAVLAIPLSVEIRLILSVSWFLVVVTELMNTAVEAVVDIASPERRPLAKRSKDVASAAVFTALVCFGTSWGYALLFGTKWGCALVDYVWTGIVSWVQGLFI